MLSKGIRSYHDPIVPGGNFTWEEYARLQQWNALAVPTATQMTNAVFLFTHLQPLRKELGKALIIQSGARTPEYTQFLRKNGTPNAALQSAHMDWAAVDLGCPGMSVAELWRFFDKRWAGRMEALAYTPYWVHLDTRQWGKRVRFIP